MSGARLECKNRFRCKAHQSSVGWQCSASPRRSHHTSLTGAASAPRTPSSPSYAACHFLFYTGKVRTPLLVQQDAAQLSMSYRVPQAGEREAFDGERGTCGHLAAQEGSWRVEAGGRMSKGGMEGVLLLHFVGLSVPALEGSWRVEAGGEEQGWRAGGCC